MLEKEEIEKISHILENYVGEIIYIWYLEPTGAGEIKQKQQYGLIKKVYSEIVDVAFFGGPVPDHVWLHIGNIVSLAKENGEVFYSRDEINKHDK